MAIIFVLVTFNTYHENREFCSSIKQIQRQMDTAIFFAKITQTGVNSAFLGTLTAFLYCAQVQ